MISSIFQTKIRVKYVFFVALLGIILDQLVKHYIEYTTTFGQSISVFEGVVSLYKVHNTGAAFSIFEGNVVPLAIISLVAAMTISFYFLREVKEGFAFYIIGWGLILGGTVGNFIDRVVHGYVIDYINLDFMNFPVFNLADSFINIGAIIVIAYIIFENNNGNDSRI